MENRYKQLLYKKENLFTKVRKSMGIGGELGLASCPWNHGYPTNGVLVPYGKTENEEYFEIPGFYEKYFSDNSPLIVRPIEGNLKLHVVSVFHQNPFYDGTSDLFLEELTDERFAGLVAHECAEFLYTTDLNKVESYDVEHELIMDALAKQMGFGKELISYFQLKMEYLKRDHGKVGSIGMMQRERLNNEPEIQQLEQRISNLK
jgi:hypothetical protein